MATMVATMVATVGAVMATATTAQAQPAQGDTVIIVTPSQPAPQAVPPPPPMQPMQQPMPQPAPYYGGPGGQPQQPPPGYVVAVPAPQNERWDNVSHINGTPVPVGERNDYLREFRRTNLSINPIGLMMGFYSISGSFAVSDNIAIRGDLSVVDLDDDDDDFTEVGIGAPIYLRRTYQGPFIEPGVIVREWADGDSTQGPQVLFGWHWTFESGLNASMALGAGRDFNKDEDSDGYDDESEQFVNGYFRVGYAF